VTRRAEPRGRSVRSPGHPEQHAADDPRTGRETGTWPVGPTEGTRACCAVSTAGGLAYLIVAEAQEADGLIYALTSAGVVHCFDAITAERRWLFTADEPAGRTAERVGDDWGEDAAEEPSCLLLGGGVLYAQTVTTLYALGGTAQAVSVEGR
jgi:outer membrane protein assembly factor BamB